MNFLVERSRPRPSPKHVQNLLSEFQVQEFGAKILDSQPKLFSIRSDPHLDLDKYNVAPACASVDMHSATIDVANNELSKRVGQCSLGCVIVVVFRWR